MYFNPAILRRLIDETGLSRPQVADAIGMSLATIDSCLSGRQSLPSLKTLSALADFFAVSIDFLVGRCDEGQVEKIFAAYPRYFMELRRAPYEAYLNGRVAFSDKSLVGEAPWPYNLLNAVFPKSQVVNTVDEEHEADIVEAIMTLPERQSEFILAYFRDGKRLDKIGKPANISGERVRQVISRGTSALRRPPQADYLLYGKRLAEHGSGIKLLEISLAARQRELELVKKKLDENYSRIVEAQEYLYDYGVEAMRMAKAITDTLEVLPPRQGAKVIDTKSIKLAELGLSMRTYNALMRLGCNTLGDLMVIAEEGSLTKIRNLGTVSAREVLARIESLTGKSFFGKGDNPPR